VPSQCQGMSAQVVPPSFSATGRHCASESIQVGGDGEGVGRSSLIVSYENRIGGHSAQPFSAISLRISGER
jgi:hypothetical protein